LTENGLAITQTLDYVGDKILIITTLGHVSGESMKSVLPVPLVKADPQTLGSAITYCRRYSLSAMVGICPIDDDAEMAMQPIRKESTKVTAIQSSLATQEQHNQIAKLIDDWSVKNNSTSDNIVAKICGYNGIKTLNELTSAMVPGVMRSLGVAESKKKTA
jgi:hypothetical protein